MSGGDRQSMDRMMDGSRSQSTVLGRPRLFLEHAAIVADTVRHITTRLVDCLHTQRPGRSYPRISRKPIGKWKPPKPA